MFVPLIVVALIAFGLASMAYVYRFRGNARFGDVKEYLRKGWPVFAPLNCLLYLFTKNKARLPIMDLVSFPELGGIQNQWETIREEAANLYRRGYFGVTNTPESQAYHDIGFSSFYKYGWSKFYLTWYGYTHQSALDLCPNTARILRQIPSVNGAMFSLLPVGSELKRHLDPVACSLRYHLGLLTPNSNDCYINIDNVPYSWRDGEALLFDETYLHYAKNDSKQYRLILMCDVERPLRFVGRFVNALYKSLMRLSVVPNIEGDKRGLVNRLLANLAPARQKMKNLKRTHRALYRVVQYSSISTLVLVVIALTTGLLYAVYSLPLMLGI